MRDRSADPGSRSIGADENPRPDLEAAREPNGAICKNARHGRCEQAAGALNSRAARQRLVEPQSRDHATAKVLGHVRLLSLNHRHHSQNGLRGY